jgi:hypothetical protein
MKTIKSDLKKKKKNSFLLTFDPLFLCKPLPSLFIDSYQQKQPQLNAQTAAADSCP